MKVRHKISGETLTIKKDFGNVVICHVPKPYYMKNTHILIDSCVCLKSNLEFEKQLKLCFN